MIKNKDFSRTTIFTFLAVSLLAFSAVLFTGCSSEETVTSSSNSVSTNATIIDVRTPEEFQSGHLEGAVNINLQSPDFVQKVQELDPNGEYVVYCRSGNRSAEAVEIMESNNFSNVSDYGSVQNASGSLGVNIVK